MQETTDAVSIWPVIWQFSLICALPYWGKLAFEIRKHMKEDAEEKKRRR